MSRRILLVDDEPDIRLIVRFILEKAGHDVTEAGDGEEALAILEGDDPDLVLLDLRMPVVDGWSVLGRLRRAGRLPDLPIVVISAHANDPSIRRALDLGCRAYISKPFLPEEILAAVELHARGE